MKHNNKQTNTNTKDTLTEHQTKQNVNNTRLNT